MTVWEPGEVFGDRVVEGELAVVRQEEDGRGRELLTDRGDVVAHGRRGGDRRIDARVAICLGVGELAAPDDGQRDARRSELVAGRGDGFVDPLLQLG
jgi:hypothetical protein